ncbi:MAG: SpoIIIAH-like family protein [Oscillospiraceae bacterium]
MKVFKRNAVIITVLLFVCAAVYLNWSYNKKAEEAAGTENAAENDIEASTDTDAQTKAETLSDTAAGDEAGLFYTGNVAESTGTSALSAELKEYFAEVRLERQQARDEASATLQTVAEAEGASQETIDEALSQMTQIAQWTVKEAEIENLIRAKGFLDCVVYLSEDGASVTVAAEDGLSNVSVAKITDVILSETDFTADQLTVTEIK